MLNLPDHVVAEIANQSGMEWRQVGQIRGVERIEDGLECSQYPPGPTHPVTGEPPEVEVAVGGHQVGACGDGGQGIAAHERIPAPPLTTLHRFEKEPAAVVTVDDLEKGGHRGDG